MVGSVGGGVMVSDVVVIVGDGDVVGELMLMMVGGVAELPK